MVSQLAQAELELPIYKGARVHVYRIDLAVNVDVCHNLRLPGSHIRSVAVRSRVSEGAIDLLNHAAADAMQNGCRVFLFLAHGPLPAQPPALRLVTLIGPKDAVELLAAAFARACGELETAVLNHLQPEEVGGSDAMYTQPGTALPQEEEDDEAAAERELAAEMAARKQAAAAAHEAAVAHAHAHAAHARAHAALGAVQRACVQAQQAQQAYEQQVVQLHAQWQAALGEAAQAAQVEQAEQKAVEAAQAASGEGPSTLLNNLGMLLQNMGQLEEARPLHEVETAAECAAAAAKGMAEYAEQLYAQYGAAAAAAQQAAAAAMSYGAQAQQAHYALEHAAAEAAAAAEVQQAMQRAMQQACPMPATGPTPPVGPAPPSVVVSAASAAAVPLQTTNRSPVLVSWSKAVVRKRAVKPEPRPLAAVEDEVPPLPPAAAEATSRPSSRLWCPEKGSITVNSAAVGSVRLFNVERGFGFIVMDGGEEHFFHVDNLLDGNALAIGARVNFVPEYDHYKAKRIATQVTGAYFDPSRPMGWAAAAVVKAAAADKAAAVSAAVGWARGAAQEATASSVVAGWPLAAVEAKVQPLPPAEADATSQLSRRRQFQEEDAPPLPPQLPPPAERSRTPSPLPFSRGGRGGRVAAATTVVAASGGHVEVDAPEAPVSDEMVAAVAREIAAAVARALEEAEDQHAEDLMAAVAATKAKMHARHEAATKLHAEAAEAAAAETEKQMQMKLEEAWSRAKASASTATVVRTVARQHEVTIARLRTEHDEALKLRDELLAAASAELQARGKRQPKRKREAVEEQEVEDLTLSSEEEEEEEGEACSTCGSTHTSKSNAMLLCDGTGCEQAFHQQCLVPPLQRIPPGEWRCPTCSPVHAAAKAAEAEAAQLKAKAAAEAKAHAAAAVGAAAAAAKPAAAEPAAAVARPLAAHGGMGFRKNDRVAVLYNVDRFSKGDWFAGKASGSDLE